MNTLILQYSVTEKNYRMETEWEEKKKMRGMFEYVQMCTDGNKINETDEWNSI